MILHNTLDKNEKIFVKTPRELLRLGMMCKIKCSEYILWHKNNFKHLKKRLEVCYIYQSYSDPCLSIGKNDIALGRVYYLLLYFPTQEWKNESIEALIEQVVKLNNNDDASGFYALLLISVVSSKLNHSCLHRKNIYNHTTVAKQWVSNKC